MFTAPETCTGEGDEGCGAVSGCRAVVGFAWELEASTSGADCGERKVY